jgi:CDP-diacylglycerol--glycerol-3-phosphate 3-phosphatidyltransferase
MKNQIAIPTAISSIRLAVLPLFFYLYSLGNTVACLGLLAFCAATDYFDGYYARRLSAASKLGAYFDATTDFALTAGIFAFFTLQGFYPLWLVLLIAISFIQFIITSVYAKKLYDPVGRYLGSALYIGIVLTLLFPVQTVFFFVQYAFAVFFLVSLASRVLSFTKNV